MSLVDRELPRGGRIEINERGSVRLTDDYGGTVSFYDLRDLEIIRDVFAAAAALQKAAQP